MSEVTAVIPHHNRSHLLEELLVSLKRQTTPIHRIVVIDNGSTDGSRRVAQTHGAVWLPLGANMGFARAVNKGVQAASTRWVVILNNDVTLAPDCIEQLFGEARRQDVAFAVPRLLSARDPRILDGTYDLLCRGGCALRAGHGEPDGPAWRRVRAIRFAPFTAVLFDREVFLSFGGLDERFESYMEDVDFSLRLAVAGHRGVFVPEAQGTHEGSATFGAWSARVVRLLARNQTLLIHLNYPPELRRSWRRPILAAQLLWGLAALRHGRLYSWLQGKREARVLAGLLDPRVHAASEVRRVVEDSERELETITRHHRFWRLYFRLAGQGG
jgi:hypothetical protein